MGFRMKSVRAVQVLSLVMTMMVMVGVSAQGQSGPKVAPSTMAKTGTVDARFLSYNVEMVEVTGGRFWRPYGSRIHANEQMPTAASQSQPVGVNPNMLKYRPPIDLSNARLRNLAKALGPAYIRVSGSWANSTYFQDNDLPALKEPPSGFRSVQTRAEWKGFVDFARAPAPGLSHRWRSAQARGTQTEFGHRSRQKSSSITRRPWAGASRPRS